MSPPADHPSSQPGHPIPGITVYQIRQGGNYTQPHATRERWGGPTSVEYIAYVGGTPIGTFESEPAARMAILEHPAFAETNMRALKEVNYQDVQADW
jgi:hypothetical protein